MFFTMNSQCCWNIGFYDEFFDLSRNSHFELQVGGLLEREGISPNWRCAEGRRVAVTKLDVSRVAGLGCGGGLACSWGCRNAAFFGGAETLRRPYIKIMLLPIARQRRFYVMSVPVVYWISHKSDFVCVDRG